ncbi:hypothetical protein AGLY_009686 [Aphis glycines]|uniref:Uncharacterized protein n=1 Tax=Aphis glycines TaxID=307491 RepID=A0A6G0THU5_APHGL|nr:hypothetical protein AGLY_009686 [Aphis glycines]
MRNIVLNFQLLATYAKMFIENCWTIVGKCLLLTSITHQRYSLFYRKPPPKFEIEALLRIVMLITYEKLCIKFSITIRTTRKESCIKFSSFFDHPKFFYRHSKKKSHKNRKFQWSINNSNKSKTGFAVKIPVFPSLFHVFLDFFGNCWKMFTFDLYNAPRIFTFPSETIPKLCCTQTQKQKTKNTSLYNQYIHHFVRNLKYTVLNLYIKWEGK